MFHSRQLNKKINKIQERALKIVDKNAESTHSELLEKDCAVTIHTKNLQLLMTEIYKTRNDLNPSFMQEIFCEVITICETMSNLFSLGLDRWVMAQKASDLKVHNYGKCYRKQYETRDPSLSLK